MGAGAHRAAQRLAGCPQEGVGSSDTSLASLSPHQRGPAAGGAVGDMRSMGRGDPAAPHDAAPDQLLALYFFSFSSVLFRGGE